MCSRRHRVSGINRDGSRFGTRQDELEVGVLSLQQLRHRNERSTCITETLGLVTSDLDERGSLTIAHNTSAVDLRARK